MEWFGFIFIVIAFIGAFNIAYQIYKLTVLDAMARGLKHPKFWGLFATGGQNQGGLLLYLIGRRKYPSSMVAADHKEMDSRKNKATVGLIFLVVGAIGVIIYIVLL